MKRRVALISSCAPPGPGSPVTGGGLRTEQLAQTLRAAGHSVRLFVERAALGPKAPKELRDHAFDGNSLADQVRSFRPSVLVVEQWALVPLISELNKPLVVDLHGSLLLENVFRRGDIDLVLDAGSKIQALSQADLLLVPAEVQVHHFSSWATLAGFDPRELPIALLPLAMPDEPTQRKTKRPPLRVVYGGARWPWIDSLSALRTAADVIASIPDAHLDVFTFEPPRHGLDFEEDLGTWPQALSELANREEQGITLHEGEPHHSWQRFLRSEATIALDLWEPNPERMLAATTRSIEFLWAGLGLVTVMGSSWSAALARTGAGWSLPPGDNDGLRDLLQELAAKPAQIAAASRAATSLIKNEHQLLEAGKHLLRFCQDPKRPTRSAQTLPEALVVIREEQLATELRSLEQAHAEEHRELIASHRDEQNEDRDRNTSEMAVLTARHREEVSALVRDNQGLISRLEAQHKEKMQELVSESRSQLKEAAKEASRETKSAAKEHRAAMMTAAKEHRAQLKTQAKEHQSESKELVSQWRVRLKELEGKLTHQQRTHETELRLLAEEHRSELQDIVAAHRGQITALTDQHSTQLKQQAVEHNATLAARDKRAREELQQAVLDHRDEIESLADGNRRQIKELAAERQDEVQKLVGQSRAELEQADERHRAETQARIDEMQHRHDELQSSIEVLKEQLASERRRVKEERARLEVELRAEMSARELELQQEMVNREAEFGELLERANRSLAEKVRGRLTSTDKGPFAASRLAPAARLARLWAEHAVDHAQDEQEE